MKTEKDVKKIKVRLYFVPCREEEEEEYKNKEREVTNRPNMKPPNNNEPQIQKIQQQQN